MRKNIPDLLLRADSGLLVLWLNLLFDTEVL
jgi:hypothetical protein